jgi:hypothetical protein
MVSDGFLPRIGQEGSDQDRLRALYPNHDESVSAGSLAAKNLVAKRYILQEDADVYIEAAEQSAIGRRGP